MSFDGSISVGDAVAVIAVLLGGLTHFRTFGYWQGRLDTEIKALTAEVQDLKRKIEAIMRRSDRTTPPPQEA